MLFKRQYVLDLYVVSSMDAWIVSEISVPLFRSLSPEQLPPRAKSYFAYAALFSRKYAELLYTPKAAICSKFWKKQASIWKLET